MSENNQPNNNVVLGGAAAAGASPVRNDESAHNHLPNGTRLGEFEIVGLVGEGGFGIVYLAQDHSLQRKVALKEYMPASLASRGSDASVIVRSERHRETFNIGRRSFVNEARLLAQFDHAALVKVYRFWEANGTAYMVMPFYDGQTLRDVLYQRDTAPDEAWIKKILAPVIDALELIHRDNCFHRDIAPDNIMLLPGDRPVLLDFGAARRVIGDMTQALTVILKPGYAPIEQYAEMPGMKQGPWTDVYALAAVIYFMIARKLPPPSVSRIMQDSYEPLATLAAGHYSETLLRGVDLCLTVRPEQRPQSMADMRQAIGIYATQIQPAPAISAPKPSAKPAKPAKPAAKPAAANNAPAKPSNKSSSHIRSLIAVLISFAVVGGVVFYLTQRGGTGTPSLEPTHTDNTPPNKTPNTQNSAVVVSPPTKPNEQEIGKPVAQPNLHSLDEALAALGTRATPKMAPSLQVPASFRVDTDTLKLSLKTNTAGHLYLFLWDKSQDRFYRIFPNELDKANALSAGATFSVPRSNLPIPWNFPANAPKGGWQVLALLSETPRDISASKLVADGGFASADHSALDAGFAGGAGLEALIGTPICAPNTVCEDHFGLARASTSKVDAPIAQIEPPKPETKPTTKPVRTDTAPKANANANANADSGTHKPQAAPADNSDRAEREYMKQLNKDLDKLLSK